MELPIRLAAESERGCPGVPRFRWLWALAVGLGTQLLYGLTSTPPALLVASMVMIAVFLFGNRTQSGFWLVLVGLLLNIVVIGANGHMPVSAGAIRSASLADVPVSDLRHGIVDESSALTFLGDVLTVGGRVVSLGDVLMLMGLLVFIGVSSRRLLSRSPNLEPRGSGSGLT